AENSKQHFADTRDTLCYATNENQSATLGLLNTEADLAIVVGGYNSSNTSHLVELCETKFPTYFISSAKEIVNANEIKHFDYHTKTMRSTKDFLPNKEKLKIVISSGASCPDSLLEEVINKINQLTGVAISNESAMKSLSIYSN
ncbi:MAG TPA: 4-hydroxy-3-methylbut-2-enyl diphosphate reductase, partial [Bacteroidia bacterium]|nr:4-hydroxy-3-methylbut-2-enyl diphosphate reductase [Bacteroidia bacterium]